MLSITRKIVNDRISNRVDNVIGTGLELAERLLRCTHELRCLTHQQCGDLLGRFDVFALERGHSPRGWGRGLKRYAFGPAQPVMPAAATPTRRYWLATSSSSVAGHRAVSYAG